MSDTTDASTATDSSGAGYAGDSLEDLHAKEATLTRQVERERLLLTIFQNEVLRLTREFHRVFAQMSHQLHHELQQVKEAIVRKVSLVEELNANAEV